MKAALLRHTKRLEVLFIAHSSEPGVKVGTLVEIDGRVAFEFDPEFQRLPFSLSPFHLPHDRAGLQYVAPAHEHLFFGLHCVFGDSLPDGWGLLGPGGEQSTTVVGEGRTPGPEHLLQLAKVCDVRPKFAKFALEAIAEARVWIRSELAAAGYRPRS